jgi:hypothetical protein
MIKTKKEALTCFKRDCLFWIEEQEKEWGCGVDKIYRREVWNNWVDSMLKDRQLPKRAIEWSNPFQTKRGPYRPLIGPVN